MKDGTCSDARVLSILEILRLSGLPDDWNFPEWATDNFLRQLKVRDSQQNFQQN